jgi:hypothetical protein
MQERIDEKWKALEKRGKKEAKKGGEGYIPQEDRPEANFVASLVDEFVKVRPPPPPPNLACRKTHSVVCALAMFCC